MNVEHGAPPPFPKLVLKVEALACRRGEKRLFEGLDFTLGSGEVLALRGPNGVGKTTLLLTIAGAFRPESGRIVLDGLPKDSERTGYIGFLGYQTGLKDRLTLAENLRFWDAMNGQRSDPAPILERVGLAPIADLVAGHLSSGQTRRLSIARLVSANRPIWLLDEPTAALDRTGEALLGRLMDEHLQRGGLIIAATHHDLPVSESARAKTLELGRVAA